MASPMSLISLSIPSSSNSRTPLQPPQASALQPADQCFRFFRDASLDSRIYKKFQNFFPISVCKITMENIHQSTPYTGTVTACNNSKALFCRVRPLIILAGKEFPRQSPYPLSVIPPARSLPAVRRKRSPQPFHNRHHSDDPHHNGGKWPFHESFHREFLSAGQSDFLLLPEVFFLFT